MDAYPLLSNITSPHDVGKLTLEQLESLCTELRLFLITNISQTGGHLASNLGIVEIATALEHIFHSPQDKIIYDVGHQCYVHKLLTGRRDQFHTLRQLGGISGFPRPDESEYDAFIGGHASMSVSAALGMARARTLMGRKESVVCVIGDGALTGGMAYSQRLCAAIEERVGFLAPVLNFAGEEEMEALAAGAYRVLTGKQPALDY